MTSTREEANITHLLCRGRTGKSSQNLRTGGCAPAYGRPINSRGKRGTEGRSSQDQTRKRLRQSRRGCWEAPTGSHARPADSSPCSAPQRSASRHHRHPSSVLGPLARCRPRMPSFPCLRRSHRKVLNVCTAQVCLRVLQRGRAMVRIMPAAGLERCEGRALFMVVRR